MLTHLLTSLTRFANFIARDAELLIRLLFVFPEGEEEACVGVESLLLLLLYGDELILLIPATGDLLIDLDVDADADDTTTVAAAAAAATDVDDDGEA